MINAPWIRPYRPLVHGEHALYYESDHVPLRSEQRCDGLTTSRKNLTETIETALRNGDRLSKMAQEARRHVLRYHTHQAIVEHILDSVDESSSP